MKPHTANPLQPVALCVLLALSLFQTGCALLFPKADRTQFYVLRASEAGRQPVTSSRTAGIEIRIGPGSVASYLDSEAIALHQGINRIKFLNRYHWAEPLPKGIARVLDQNLKSLLGVSHTTLYPNPLPGEPGVELHYTVQRFEGTLDGPVTLDVDWHLIERPGGRAVSNKHSIYEIQPSSPAGGVEDYVERLSRALDQWSEDVAASIRSR